MDGDLPRQHGVKPLVRRIDDVTQRKMLKSTLLHRRIATCKHGLEAFFLGKGVEHGSPRYLPNHGGRDRCNSGNDDPNDRVDRDHAGDVEAQPTAIFHSNFVIEFRHCVPLVFE
ncbi:hypothetical protein IL59_0208425 [Brucella suis bv. 4 str. 40]|nr:hypothetical protein IL59_0208425 [Brucella suis bv. 4 str. 40]